MKVTKEVKRSDGNYGNITTRIEGEVEAENLPEVMSLLDEWTELAGSTSDDEMTPRLVARREQERTEVLDRLSKLMD